MTSLGTLQMLNSLREQVLSVEADVHGFSKTIDDLRAAGRIEAMEDMMHNLLGDLVRPLSSCLPVCLPSDQPVT